MKKVLSWTCPGSDRLESLANDNEKIVTGAGGVQPFRTVRGEDRDLQVLGGTQGPYRVLPRYLKIPNLHTSLVEFVHEEFGICKVRLWLGV